VGRNVFIHHNGALGDILLSLPAIETLRRPHDRVHLAAREDVAVFLKEFGFISGGLRSDGRLFLSLFTDSADNSIKEFVARFDAIYVFTPDENCQLAAGIRSLFEEARVIRTLPPPEAGMHVADYRSEQVGQFEESSLYPLLAVPRNHRETAELILRKGGYDCKRPLVAVHPGSGGKKKRWPIERFLEVMRRLRTDIDCFLIIFSGPAEDRELRKEIESCAEGLKNDSIIIADAGLATVASLLSLCDLYLGNDSGITHLASFTACGKIIALFGPTDPLLWAPKSDRCSVITPAREFSARIGSVSKDGPGEFPAECGAGRIEDITVESVLDEVMGTFKIFIA
jgi:heptosyltransferase-3